MKREQFEELVIELRSVFEMAEMGAEANQAVTEYYQPIELAAQRVIDAAGVSMETSHVQVPKAAFDKLFEVLYGRKPNE